MAFYEENPGQITGADIVVGIPTANEVESIAVTTARVDKGLSEYFPGMRCVIIDCDNHSSDGTREAFFAAPGTTPRLYISTEPGVGGKGRNIVNFFQRARQLDPKALIILEADIKNISPVWIRNLGTPILKGAGFVCPLYVRHKYEATLTSSIIYPLFRCLYGRRVRQCNVGVYGFSPKLLDSYLNPPFWSEMLDNYGADIWMANVALASRLPVVQAIMGSPKVHRLKDSYLHLPVFFHEVVGTIFDLMQVYQDFWKQVKWSKPTALFGTDLQEVETPLPVDMNTKRLHEMFIEGFDNYYGLWEQVYGPMVVPKLQEIRSIGLQHFSFPTQTWMTILFDSAVAYRWMSPAERKNLLDGLLPLYLGKVLSYVKKTERMSLQQAEDYIENECMIFEENKPYILKVWTKGEGG
ncbi:Glycosyl transferase, family 2 [Syntrophobacter sp. SbD1]|nr:Glycosyl transferase, family 2 [Syntrophobacter sp. SbD1]